MFGRQGRSIGWSGGGSGRPWLAGLLLSALLAGWAAGGARGEATPTHITLFGDSVATALAHDEAYAVLARGLDLGLEVEVCRRLTGQSCPYEGERPSNLVDAVTSHVGPLGPVVLVVAGYNEPPESFAAGVDAVLTALRAAGAPHVVWANLSAATPAYQEMNGTLLAIADVRSELTVLDWNGASEDTPAWFQNDHIHLTTAGAAALARLLRKAVDDLLAAAPVVAPAGPAPARVAPVAPALPPAVKPLAIAAGRAALPRGTVGTRYAARLVARGGRSPYRFAIRSGSLPRGLRLLPDGRLVGVPLVAGAARVVVRVVDARGRAATRSAAIRVDRR